MIICCARRPNWAAIPFESLHLPPESIQSHRTWRPLIVKVLTTLLLAGFLLLPLSNTQAISLHEEETLDYLKNALGQIDVNRISLVSGEMQLEGKAASSFWPRYQKYLHRQIALRDRQLVTLKNYSGHFIHQTLDDVAAAGLLKESMLQERERQANRQRFIVEIKDILNPRQQLRLYQLELLIDAELRTALLTQVPLAN
jgi:hypothetical protein